MRDFFRRWVFFWIWCAFAGSNLGFFIGGVFLDRSLMLVLANYIAFVICANGAHVELEWCKEQRRLESIARARGYLV
jgi:hypothetical protein